MFVFFNSNSCLRYCWFGAISKVLIHVVKIKKKAKSLKNRCLCDSGLLVNLDYIGL